ncbi:hypothetical protein NUW54_g5822 [Trametes sanguinea]|uniref:Uncharacterized protein n=1 Tax=Trametes sanguinea TaxID=158606 RepID=A0ACC1PW37_9APHY|nr:hypothetical protein NUW54_g5822 [Trametes sanguinea]
MHSIALPGQRDVLDARLRPPTSRTILAGLCSSKSDISTNPTVAPRHSTTRKSHTRSLDEQPQRPPVPACTRR